MPHRETGTADVVGGDVGRLGAGHFEVDADQRDVRLDELRDLGIFGVDAHDTIPSTWWWRARRRYECGRPPEPGCSVAKSRTS